MVKTFSAKTHIAQVGPFTEFLPTTSSLIREHCAQDASRLVSADSVNRFWRDLSTIGHVTLPSSTLHNWNLRDQPLITIFHPDYEKHGAPMVEEISRRAKRAFQESSLERITTVENLPTSDLINNVLILGKDRRFHRMTVRQLNGKFLFFNLKSCYFDKSSFI